MLITVGITSSNLSSLVGLTRKQVEEKNQDGYVVCIKNEGTTNIYIGFDAPATTGGISIEPGDERIQPINNIGRINLIASVENTNIHVEIA